MLCRIQKFMPTSLYLVIKKETRRSLLKNIQFLGNSTDGWSSESNRSAFSSSQVQWEVMCVTLVHYLHPEVGTVKNISPGVEHTTLRVDDRLVEVETVEVECHGANTKSGEPDANNRPCCEEEVQRT